MPPVVSNISFFLVLGTDQAASAVELAILTLSFTSIFTISNEGRSRHLLVSQFHVEINPCFLQQKKLNCFYSVKASISSFNNKHFEPVLVFCGFFFTVR